MSAFEPIINGYAFLVRLYPSEFRTEFDAEMKSVFTSRLHELSHEGRWSALAVVCLLELVELPLNLLREYASRLIKEIRMGNQLPALDPKRASLLGALGFGMGFALLILLRGLIDPANDAAFNNLGSAWLRETFLFATMGVLGGALIGFSGRSTRMSMRLALAGGLGCCIGGSLGTLFLYWFYLLGFPGWMAETTPAWLNYLPHIIASMIIGAFTGAALGVSQGDRQQTVRLTRAGAIGFAVAYIPGEIVFYFAHIFWMNTQFSQFWAIPLAFTAMFNGLIAGAVLGWVMYRHNHTVLLSGV
jgi:hypothetical protein